MDEDKQMVYALTTIKELGFKLGTKEVEIFALQKKLQDQEKDVEQLRNENELSKTRVQTLNSKYESLNKAYDDLNAKASKSIAEREEQLILFSKKLNKKTRKVKSLRKQLKAKTLADPKAKEEVDALRKELHAKQQIIDQLTDNIQERADVSSSHVDALMDELYDLEAKVEELKNEKADMVSSIQKIIDLIDCKQK